METNFTSATVYFIDTDPTDVIRYKAYLSRIGGKPWCSVPSTAAHIRCRIDGIREAIDFKVVAEACRAKSCGPAVSVEGRTKIQRKVYFYSMFNMKINVQIYINPLLIL